jgi:hypothetical protein
MAGRVTVAKGIKGERRGQRAERAWTFTSACASGPCPTVALVRQRTGGIDRLTLSQRSPGHYTGTSMFYAPLRCGGHDYRRGESVPFTITVTITAAQIVDGLDIATQVNAPYRNRARKNRTRCVALPGHDAALYIGLLLTLPPPPTDGVSGQSPAGS